MTTTPTLNVPLLRKVMEYIETHPEDWNQDTWGARYVPEAHDGFDQPRQHSMTPCATACCFAGNTVLLAGGEFLSPWGSSVRIDDQVIHAADVAADLLGLTGEQAEELFYGGNGLDDLRRLVDEYITEAEAE